MGKEDLAIDRLTKGIEKSPRIVDNYYIRGCVYIKLNNFDLAIADFKKILEMKPYYAKAHCSLGICYCKIKEYSLALTHFNNAIENSFYLFTAKAWAYYNRGVFHLEFGHYDQAINDLVKAIESAPLWAEAYCQLGNAFFAVKNYDGSVANYKKAILLYNEEDANTKRAETYLKLGKISGIKGEYDQMITDCIKSINLKSDLSEAYYFLGIAFFYKGDFDRAIAEYTRAIDFVPMHAAVHNDRGYAYFSKGEFDQSIIDYTQAIYLNPDWLEPYYNRGHAYIKRLQFKDAKCDFLRVLRQLDEIINDPTTPSATREEAHEKMLLVKESLKYIPENKQKENIKGF